MNIFVTDICPVKSAYNLDDKRVVKMILESAQLLSTALRLHDINVDGLYKMTHVNHPCNVWTRASRANYNWLVRHFKALCDNYKTIYGKTHKCESMFNIFKQHAEALPDLGFTEFANCAANQSLGVSFKDIEVTLAYRQYLTIRWKHDKRVPTWGKVVKNIDTIFGGLQ